MPDVTDAPMSGGVKRLEMHGPDDDGRVHPDCPKCEKSIRGMIDDLARVTAARDDALDAWEDLIEKYERQAEEIAALKDVALAAAQYLADVNADFRTWGSAVKLEQALARLDAAPAEARE